AAPAAPAEQESDSDNEHDKGAPPVEDDVPVTEQAEMARAFVAGLVEAFGVPATVTATVEEDTVEVAVDGSDLGMLIGPKGQTLQAIQELAKTVVQRQVPGRVARLHVDVSGYREKRREALARFTAQVAEQVVATGERKALEPMNPADRKVVHDTANTIEGVTTTSEGEEPRRRVVILPADEG
ncbi:MAG TPA: R3H domain-containing nucleic acid-binding protein, partial [Acidimicrobiales bacterium]|nr:R3H domain-containing nucleic acid-binding protein [Acidimicrobiales bacterium]